MTIAMPCDCMSVSSTHPPSPITAQTYNVHGLPWFALYDEHIPMANNTSSANPLTGVRSIAQLDNDRTSARSSNIQAECGFNTYEMATLRLSSCGHVFCDDCSNTKTCPSCRKQITSKKIFAAAMPMPGKENEESYSLDERIVMLRAEAEKGKILSFMLPEHVISCLCSEL
jgi:hypothetical protein